MSYFNLRWKVERKIALLGCLFKFDPMNTDLGKANWLMGLECLNEPF